VLITV